MEKYLLKVPILRSESNIFLNENSKIHCLDFTDGIYLKNLRYRHSRVVVALAFFDFEGEMVDCELFLLEEVDHWSTSKLDNCAEGY